MYPDCHAMLGWTIGNLVPGDARLRRWATVAAILPDVDGLPIIFGANYYAQFHHTFGHNVFLWAAVSVLAWKVLRSWKAGLVVFVSFGSHIL
ncbi:MAG: metal-dependent hydrolase, partial [Limisphaerales bacterium]